jgi:hypothetical protein
VRGGGEGGIEKVMSEHIKYITNPLLQSEMTLHSIAHPVNDEEHAAEVVALAVGACAGLCGSESC